MSYATSRQPDGWQVIRDRFSEFGHVDFYCRIPAVPIKTAIGKEIVEAFTEWTLRIQLQPLHLTNASSDSEVREAMYEMAEDAIAVARENYALLTGPEIMIRGGENKSYIEGELTLEFRMRREGET